MHISTIALLLVLLTSFILTIVIDAYTRVFSATSVFGYILAIIAYYLILLDQECVHNGPCSIWGWIRVLFVIALFTLVISMKIVELNQEKKQAKN